MTITLPDNYIEWDFTPYKPVRPDITGEVVFYKKWLCAMLPKSTLHLHAPKTENTPRPEGYLRVDQYFVENPEHPNEFPVMQVWRDYGIPNAHDTRIMTNFIVWLGTNAGYSLRHEAQALIDKNIPPKHAYLYAWAHTNIRERSINYNGIYRDTVATKFGSAASTKIKDYPHPTAHDLETIENICLWLGTDNGQKFLHACQHNLDIKHARQKTAKKLKPL